MHCTHAEVGAWFGISQQAVSKKLQSDPFKSTWETGWAKGSISLRRQQKQRADAGDKTMLIWLGKQWLGQSDKQEVTHITLETIEAELERIQRERAKRS
jgi:hypothetical protein